MTDPGLPLGPLNPLKSLFKHLVPNVPKSQKVVPKVPISVQLAIFHLILTKFRLYILTKNVLGLFVIYLLTTN